MATVSGGVPCLPLQSSEIQGFGNEQLVEAEFSLGNQNACVTCIFFFSLPAPVSRVKIKIKQADKKVLLPVLGQADLINFSSREVLQFVPDCERSGQTTRIPLRVLTDLFSSFPPLRSYSQNNSPTGFWLNTHIHAAKMQGSERQQPSQQAFASEINTETSNGTCKNCVLSLTREKDKPYLIFVTCKNRNRPKKQSVFSPRGTTVCVSRALVRF